MTAEPRLTIGRGVAVLAAAILLLTGAGATFLLMRDAPGSPNEPTMRPTEPAPAAVPRTVPTPARTVGPSDGPLPDISIPLTKDAVERAGIVVAPVTTASTSGEF